MTDMTAQGKTTTTERMLYYSGVTRFLGSMFVTAMFKRLRFSGGLDDPSPSAAAGQCLPARVMI